MNIHRNPLCGRNFEYYSEDPFVTGSTGAAITNGVQSNTGIGVTVKHYTSNNQEDNRMEADNHVSERAMREIYLKGFEMTVKNAQPMALMTCYNKINGTYGAGNYDTITNALRGEWGFEGMVMTDWTAREQDILSMEAGNDMIQPGGAPEDIYRHLGKVVEPVFENDGYVTITTGFDWNTWTNATVHHWNDFIVDSKGTKNVSTDVTITWDTASVNELGIAPSNAELVDAALVNSKMNKEVANYVSDNRAVVSVKDNSKYTSDKTTEFKVTYYGDYKKYDTANLGYTQRSVFNILKMVMGSNHYALIDNSVSEAQTWTDYLASKWGFDKNDLVTYNSVAYSEIKKTSENETPKTPEQIKAEEIAKAVSENKAAAPVSFEIPGVGGAIVTYNSMMPYFGGKFKAKNFANLGITVSYNGQSYKATKGKIVLKKNADESVSNASIVITKIDGLDKKIAKQIKKATKANKKALGKIPVRIYAFRLSDATVSQLSGLKVSGKSGKYVLKYTWDGQKVSLKQKKDSFGNKGKTTMTVSAGGITISGNDMQGSCTKGFENKAK
jgi:beta-glucosidase